MKAAALRKRQKALKIATLALLNFAYRGQKEFHVMSAGLLEIIVLINVGVASKNVTGWTA